MTANKSYLSFLSLPGYAASPSSDDRWALGSESESNMPPFCRTVSFIRLLSAAAFFHTSSSSLSTLLKYKIHSLFIFSKINLNSLSTMRHSRNSHSKRVESFGSRGVGGPSLKRCWHRSRKLEVSQYDSCLRIYSPKMVTPSCVTRAINVLVTCSLRSLIPVDVVFV